MKIVPLTESVAATVNVSVPATVGVPLMVIDPDPNAGTLRSSDGVHNVGDGKVIDAKAVDGAECLVVGRVDCAGGQRGWGDR